MKENTVSTTHHVDKETYEEFCEITGRLKVKKVAVINSLLKFWNRQNKNTKAVFLLDQDRASEED